MLDKVRFKKIVCTQLEEATNVLLPQVESLVELHDGRVGKQYDSVSLDQVVKNVRRWQSGLLELFLIELGEKDNHTVRLMDTITKLDFSRCYDAKRSLRRELIDSITYLEAIIPYIDQIKIHEVIEEGSKMIKTPRLFISHSTKDLIFIEEIVSLFEFLGFDGSNMFCSSVEGYGVPLGNNIFDYLLEQFSKHELFVLFIHSPHYYESCVSLNEMGAAWALKQRYFSVLTKDMEFSKMKGVVSSQEIAIKVDAADARLRLNELKDNLLVFFSLPPVNESRWEAKRDKFLKTVTE